MGKELTDRSCLNVDGRSRDDGRARDLRGSAADRRTFVDEQYRMHAPGVYRRCLAMSGGNEAWAADRTQEVFVRLMEKLPTLDTTRPLLNWLLTVADRVCVDRLRRERGIWGRVKAALKIQQVVSLSVIASSDGEGEARDKVSRLRRALATLPANEHAAVVMKYIEDRRQTEIATVLGCSEGTVSKLLARAIRRLGESFEGDHG